MKLHRIVMMALLAAAMPATAPGAGEECGARIPQSLIDWELQRLASGKTYEDLAGPPPLAGVVDLIPVKVHIVNRSNGTGGLTIAQVDTSIQQLNTRFAQVGWTFVRMGTVDVINSDRFFNLADTLQSECDALRQVNPAPLMVNIYFTNMPTLNGLSSFSGEAVQGIILSNNAALNGSTFAHEMGHYFDLYHTHENVFGYECPSGVNCLIAGDLLCDTPADPNLFGRVRDTDCVFFHVVQPPSACLPIMPYNPSTDLLMSYAPPRCRTRFSAQQMTKMRFVRNTIRTYLRMPLYAWISDNDGLWGNPANWALGAVPQADDTATVFLPGTYTITVSDRRTVGGLRFTAEGGAQTLLVRAPGNFLSVRGKSRINRNGRIRVESGSLITGDTVTVEGGLSLEGGTLIPGGVLRLLGTGGVEHSWTAGVVSQQSSAGVVMLDSGSVWNLDGPLAKTINTGKVLNNARLVWRGGNIELPWAGELRNLSGGTIECYVDSSIRTPAGTGGGSSFNNAGLFVKRGGAGTTGIGGSLNITSNTNSGTIRAETGRILFTYIGEGTGTYFAAPGAMIDFTTGGAPGVQYTFNGASFLGGGICRLFSGPFLLRGRIRADSLLLHGGTYYDSCRFAGTVVWRGGVQNGFARWNVDTTGTFRFAGNGELRIEGAIVNDGLLIWDDSATIATYLGGGITNRSRGRFDIRSNAFLTAPFGTGSLLNDGLIHKTAGTGLTVLGGLQNVITLTNNGTIRASSGSLRLTKSGEGRGRFEADAGATLDLAANPFTLRAGATFAGAGRKRLIGGTLELDGTVHAGGLELLAGTLTGTGRFTGAASWTGSTFADRLMLTIDTTGTLDIDSATTKVNWGVVNNSGLMRLLRRCTVELRFGGTLRTLPGGVFEARADGLIHCPSGQSGGHWDNQGLFVKNGGTDTTAIGGIGQIVYTINSGLVEVRSGTLAFGSNYRQTAGRLLVNGGTVASTAGTLLAIDGGELAGTGRVTGRVGISQAGVVSPGIPGFGAASPAGEGGGAESPVLLPGIGRLEFTGPFTQSGPQTRWEMEIAGPDTLSHDRVVVAGGAGLDGTLNIRMVGSYIPDTVHVHQLATFGSRTGTFAGVTGPGSEFGFSFMPVYGTSGAGVRRAGPLSLPQTPVPVSPRDSALIAADSSTVRWRVTLPGVTRYWVEWATNAGFSPKSVDSMVTDTARVLRGFALGQRVWWRVRGYNATGWGPVSAAWSFVRVATGVDPKEPLTEETPTVHTLAQNYPNPFNPSTTIRFGLPQAERVSLTVYDAVGREIARLAEGGYPAGAHSVVFDAKGLSSGIYFYRMTAGSFTEVRKLILIK